MTIVDVSSLGLGFSYDVFIRIQAQSLSFAAPEQRTI
jgi:hypothetical protein